MNLNIILLCSSLTILSSCNGQVKNTENITESAINTGTIVQEIDKSIWVLFQDKKNNYWFGSNGNGIYCYDGKTIKQFTTKDGLYSNQIRGIQEDKSGNIYFETPNGISKFSRGKFISLTPVKSPVNQWKLQPDDLWFKRNGESIGAYRYDGDKLYELNFSALSSKEFNSEYAVYSIYKDKMGNIWFGTLTAGVCRFDGNNLQWIYENELGALEDGRVPAIRSVLEDKDGYFWFSNLLYQYHIKDSNQKSFAYERVKRIDLSRQKEKMKLPYYTSAILENETIWMTNYNEGVWKYDGKNLSNYFIKEGETNVLPICIYKDNSGSLWLGTDNAGVYKFNRKVFEKFIP